MPDLDDFYPSRLDSIGQQVVTVYDQFAETRNDFAPNIRVSLENFCLGADFDRQFDSGAGVVLRYVFNNLVNFGKRSKRPLDAQAMLHSVQRKHLPPRPSRTRHGPPQQSLP